jgi:EmrB/QacA subfamily drug resistance transporter
MPDTTPSHVRSRWLALSVLCVGTLMVILDGTIVAVALPTIQTELGFTQSTLAWVVNAYLIAFAGLLLLSGRLGDLIGRKRVLLTGLVIFTVASLLCGLTGSQELLVIFRFTQGVGGALASAVVLGMIVTLFPEPREQAKAIGIYTFVQAGGASLGLIAGGVLTQTLNWHWAFFINIPIGLAAVSLAWRLFETDRGLGLREGADVAGAVLVTSGLMLLVYTIVKADEYTWGDARTLGLLALSLILLASFVVRQAKASKPLLPLRIFRARSVSGANVIMVLMVAGMFGFQFMTALYLQRVLGLGSLQTGLAFLPAPVLIALVSLGLAARLNLRFGPRTVLGTSLGLVAVALGLLARVPVDGFYAVDVLPVLILLGAAFGAAMPALIGQAMSAATPSDSGIASGLINTTQQIGAAVGTAVLATVAASRTEALLDKGDSIASALTEGFHVAYGFSAGFVVVAMVVAVVVLRRPNAEVSVPVLSA